MNHDPHVAGTGGHDERERTDDDGDGLSNAFEMAIGTDPGNADSDLDSLDDFTEIYVYGTDPNQADTDGDGVGDNSDAFPKDPAETRDTDGDGVADDVDACPNKGGIVATSIPRRMGLGSSPPP